MQTPLHGQYIALDYTEFDGSMQGSALFVGRINNNTLDCLFTPAIVYPNQFDEKCLMISNGEYLTPTQMAIYRLKEQEAREITTIEGQREFFNLLLREKNQKEGSNSWHMYSQIGSKSTAALLAAQIKIHVLP